MISAIDILKRLYSTSSPLPVLARSVGLITTNALAPIKVTYFTRNPHMCYGATGSSPINIKNRFLYMAFCAFVVVGGG